LTDGPDPTASKGYQLTDTAEVELEDVLGFVADRDGVQRALHVHGKFVEAFELLAFQPGSGTTRPKLTGQRVRWWPVFKWIVIYDPTSSPISILRVIHGARELDRLFGEDE
jgi:antitoxin ParD1/3/4/toxin ParE1/3/4